MPSVNREGEEARSPDPILEIRGVSLDFSILNTLWKTYGLTYLFITHDLYCVPYVCDEVAIMYGGKLMERFDLDLCTLQAAVHPYTRLLLASVPVKSPSERRDSRRFFRQRISRSTP
jgi:ABC-type oligopeptide transport system ATPase subunit